jgi:hypothetical protein
MDLQAYIRLLQTADAQIDRESAALLVEATEDIKTYAKSIMHRQTGNMIESTYSLGPFPIGEGALETQIASGAWYAEEEVARGGDHDWVTRTIDEQQARIAQLEADLAAAAASILTGGGNGS